MQNDTFREISKCDLFRREQSSHEKTENNFTQKPKNYYPVLVSVLIITATSPPSKHLGVCDLRSGIRDIYLQVIST